MAITPCQKVTSLEYLLLAGVAMIVICALFSFPDVLLMEEEDQPGECIDPFF